MRPFNALLRLLAPLVALGGVGALLSTGCTRGEAASAPDAVSSDMGTDRQSQRSVGDESLGASPSFFEIGTFNIRYATLSDGPDAWPNRRREVCAMLDAGEVWGLQEVLPEQLDEILRACPTKAHVARTREVDPSKGESCAILFDRENWDLDPLEHGTFWLSETPDVPGSKSWDSSIARIATFARLVDRSDASRRRAFSIYNVHLDHRGSVAREEQVEVVLARIAARRHADEPVVLVGDFNTGPDSVPIATVLAATPAFTDAWRAANPGAPEQGTFNGWKESCGTTRIDFVFTRGLAVERATIDLTRRANGRWPSDHVPVRAVVGFARDLGL
ncbi:MAG: endonuclease/exonuclease/phosphatase family protein [Planctomycetaceae bacterium]|nr:endonuclease/exonuclease/phosphatase family protein [Planctomycetaceae bacterium]